MKQQKIPSIVAIIPARYQSVRFPGKPLEKIAGKSLIQHTYENTKRCVIIEKIIIATDDQRICDHVQGFGAEAVMTSSEHPTGSDRIAAVVAANADLQRAEVIVNIQGDEPCIDPETIEMMIHSLQADQTAVMSTAVVRFSADDDIANPTEVKCVIGLNGEALYFSRSVIPGNKTGKIDKTTPYYKHLGIYAFRPQFLLAYPKLPMTPLQIAEDLEQLKIIEHGYKIKVVVASRNNPGVNVPEDISKVEQELCKQNSSL
jgi:3-deoxy-manno-octulosonate cytidylyltransferase (CMP-KDO synthetase)